MGEITRNFLQVLQGPSSKNLTEWSGTLCAVMCFLHTYIVNLGLGGKLSEFVFGYYHG